MPEPALSEQPLLLVPSGSEWRSVFPGLSPGDIDAMGDAIARDFAEYTGAPAETSFHEEEYISGLGAEAPFFLFDLWTWVGRAADTITLAMLGAKLVKYVADTARRLQEADIDPIEAGKLRPVMGAPLMKLVAAKYAMDLNPGRAESLEDWRSEPMFSRLVGGPSFFHAQQSYLVTAFGPQDGFVAVFDAYASPRKVVWVNPFEARDLGL